MSLTNEEWHLLLGAITQAVIDEPTRFSQVILALQSGVIAKLDQQYDENATVVAAIAWGIANNKRVRDRVLKRFPNLLPILRLHYGKTAFEEWLVDKEVKDE